jgi:hypothetical protein
MKIFGRKVTNLSVNCFLCNFHCIPKMMRLIGKWYVLNWSVRMRWNAENKFYTYNSNFLSEPFGLWSRNLSMFNRSLCVHNEKLRKTNPDLQNFHAIDFKAANISFVSNVTYCKLEITLRNLILNCTLENWIITYVHIAYLTSYSGRW